MTPQVLAYLLHCLPPILHMQSQIPMSSYSKGAQGLSVFLRERGIFTATSISPSLWPRQCGDRYAIRAGRNLPDKEFRYLRTVIVTAAVYRGFNSELRLRLLLLLTFRHRAGVSPYTSSCDFAQTYVFSKQSPPPFLCGSPTLWRVRASPGRAPLLPKVRGYFAEFLGQSSLERLGLFIPPTCVGFRYGSRALYLGAFLGSLDLTTSRSVTSFVSLLVI